VGGKNAETRAAWPGGDREMGELRRAIEAQQRQIDLLSAGPATASAAASAAIVGGDSDGDVDTSAGASGLRRCLDQATPGPPTPSPQPESQNGIAAAADEPHVLDHHPLLPPPLPLPHSRPKRGPNMAVAVLPPWAVGYGDPPNASSPLVPSASPNASLQSTGATDPLTSPPPPASSARGSHGPSGPYEPLPVGHVIWRELAGVGLRRRLTLQRLWAVAFDAAKTNRNTPAQLLAGLGRLGVPCSQAEAVAAVKVDGLSEKG
jgi:hypothetical protein